MTQLHASGEVYEEVLHSDHVIVEIGDPLVLDASEIVLGLKELKRCIEKNDAHCIEELAHRLRGHLSTPDSLGLTPLHHAAALDNAYAVTVLLGNSASAHALSPELLSPLGVAISRRAEGAVRAIFAVHGFRQEAESPGQTPLTLALLAQDWNIANHILNAMHDAGVGLSVVDARFLQSFPGLSTFFITRMLRHPIGIVEMLRTVEGGEGVLQRMLGLLALSEERSHVAQLLRAGVDGSEFARVANLTPRVRTLLDSGDGEELCAYFQRADGIRLINREAIRSSAPFSISEETLHFLDDAGFGFIHYFAQMGLREQVEEMVHAGADINMTDRFGNTALHWAAYANQTDLVVWLLGHGANHSRRNVHGRRAIDVATRRSSQLDYAIITHLSAAEAIYRIPATHLLSVGPGSL